MSTFNRYTLVLKVKPPFITQHLGVLPFGYDNKTLTDDLDYYLIPSTLLKGHIREELTDINQQRLANDWFGEEGEHTNDGKSGSIVFATYLKSTEPLSQFAERTRVSPTDDQGNIVSSQLQVSAVADAPADQDTLDFTLDIVIHDKKARNIAQQLTDAIKLIHAIGSDKSIGYGVISNVSIDEKVNPEKVVLDQTIHRNIHNKTIGISIKPHWHFCFPYTENTHNLVPTLDYIPGSAIKAAFASRLNVRDFQELFDATTFSHAQPISNDSNKLPRAIAHSTVFHQQEIDDYINLAMQEEESSNHGLLAFQSDWKNAQLEIAKQQNNILTPLKRSVTVRNKHSDNKNAASTGNLFSLESIDPDQKKGSQPLLWAGTICFPESVSDDAIEHFLSAISNDPILQQGLLPKLGKTHTPASFSLHKPFSRTQGISQRLPKNKLAITLQSDAWLLNTDEVNDIDLHDTKALRMAYQTVFDDLFGHDCGLKLEQIYTEEKLAKQNHHWRNVGKHSTLASIVLSAEGSVFVFDTNQVSDSTTKDVSKLLNESKRLGLPQRSCNGYNTEDDQQNTFNRHSFKHNRYLRENGYGAISIANGNSSIKLNSI